MLVEFLAFGIFWPSLARGSGGTCRHKSRLSSVHFVLQEWYLRVDVDAKTGKDKKVLRDKFHRFLPAVSSMGWSGLIWGWRFWSCNGCGLRQELCMTDPNRSCWVGLAWKLPIVRSLAHLCSSAVRPAHTWNRPVSQQQHFHRHSFTHFFSAKTMSAVSA